MIQTEDREIDRALELCKQIHSDLINCVNIVQRLNRKYNEPDRYATFDIDHKRPHHRDNRAVAPINRRSTHVAILLAPGLANSTKLSMSTLSLASSGSEKIEGRTSHELNTIFVNLKSKCIKLRRELEATAAHAQRITECSIRQGRVQHMMLRDAQTSKMLICKHWGNNLSRKGLQH